MHAAQVNITWLAHLTSAVAVGIVAGTKLLPQYAASSAFEGHVNASPTSLAGAVLVIASGLIFSYARARRAPRLMLHVEGGGHFTRLPASWTAEHGSGVASWSGPRSTAGPRLPPRGKASRPRLSV